MKNESIQKNTVTLVDTYFNPNHIFRIRNVAQIRPALRDSHCWYERDMTYKGKLYAHVTLIRGGGEGPSWLIPHKYLVNTKREREEE